MLTAASLALPPVRSVTVRDGRLVVNGAPFFPVGIYHAAHWHKGLREAGAQGFNLVQTHGSSAESFRQDIDDAFANERPGYDWRISETAPTLWAQWADLTAELRCLAPQLLAPPAVGAVQVEVTKMKPPVDFAIGGLVARVRRTRPVA